MTQKTNVQDPARVQNQAKWLFPLALLVVGVLIYATRGILLPFISGIAIAYLLDPVADRLEARRMPRGAAAALVIALFFTLSLGVLIAFWPILQSQLGRIASVLPDILAGIRTAANDVLLTLVDRFDLDLAEKAEGLLTGAASEGFQRVQSLVAQIFESGLALFNLIGLMLISPVVAFYLLRDWDRIIAEMDSWLPDELAPVVRGRMTEIDGVLGGFVRGQLMICSIMGALYGLGWTLAGLDFGLLLGLLAGILAFVPFLGVLLALGFALLVAIGQSGFDPTFIGLVVAVFVVVQGLEGVVLTPKLVGDQVGLHPVWVLFAVFAGGELMGFLGVLIAVPAAAIIAVLVRYALDQHKKHYALMAIVPPATDSSQTDLDGGLDDGAPVSDGQGKKDGATDG